MSDYICENCGKGGMLQFSYQAASFWGAHHVCAKCFTALTKREQDLESARKPLKGKGAQKVTSIILPVGKLAPDTVVITRTQTGYEEEVKKSDFKGEER